MSITIVEMPGYAHKGLAIALTKPFTGQVESLYPAAYWRLSDSGSAQTDMSGHGRTAYHDTNQVNSAPVLGTGIGDGNQAILFDGSTKTVDLYSASLAAAFSGAAGSFMIWAKVANAGIWTDGLTHRILELRVDGNNYMEVNKNASNNTLQFTYVAGGTVRYIALNSYSVPYTPAFTDWMSIFITWEKAKDEFKCFLNGYQQGGTLTGLGNWAGSLSASYTALGSIGSYPNGTWYGPLAQAALFSLVQTPLQIRNLTAAAGDGNPVFIGDSIVQGYYASDAPHRWVNIVSAAKGWTSFNNEGIPATNLQNTVQNTVATIGGPSQLNGRDTFWYRACRHRPGWVFILYGINDMRLADAAYTVGAFQAQLGEVVQGMIDLGVPANHIVIGSPSHVSNYAGNAPYNGGSSVKHATYVTACNAVATAKGTRFIDVRGWMIANGGDSLLSGDGVHPNDAGHAAIAAAFLSVL